MKRVLILICLVMISLSVMPQVANSQPAGVQVDEKAVFGGRPLGEWRQMFNGLEAQLQQVDNALAEVKKQGGDGKTALTREQISTINAKNRQLFEQREQIRLRYNSLVDEANKAGLTAELLK